MIWIALALVFGAVVAVAVPIVWFMLRVRPVLLELLEIASESAEIMAKSLGVDLGASDEREAIDVEPSLLDRPRRDD